MKSLHFLIGRLIGGLLVLTFVAIMSVVWFSLNKHANSQIQKNIEIGKRVLQQTLIDRESMLISSAQVLTADFGFKQAVASQDIETIRSVLQNHGDRIGAELMVLLDLEGNYLSSAALEDSADKQLFQQAFERIDSSKASHILKFGDVFFQCVIVEVKTPLPTAKAVLGFRLDEQFVKNLKSLTNLEISLLQISSDTKNSVPELINPSSVISTIRDDEHELLKHLSNREIENPILFFSSESFYSKSIQLDKNSLFTTEIVLSENVRLQFNNFRLLQINILLIAFLALVLTLFIGAVFSRKLSKPLYRMVTKTKRIAQGDYQSTVDDNNSVYEISQLADSIDSMRHDISKRQAKIEFLATHDSLTGLSNRFQLEQLLKHHIDSQTKEENKQSLDRDCWLVGLKLKNLKVINLSFGHKIGDEYIKAVANRIEKLDGDITYLGAGEFIWMPQKQFTIEVIGTLKSQLESKYLIDETAIEAKFSFGFLSLSERFEDAKTILRKLSLCVESASTSREPYLEYQPEMEKVFQERVDILHELEKVLADESSEISVHYQPKVSLKNNEPIKMEALIRWNSSKLGFVNPELFISIAEASGLIKQITQLVIGRVIRDILSWQSQGLILKVAINLSAQDVEDEEILDFIKSRLKSAKLNSSQLAFEITEGELISQGGATSEVLTSFRNSGFTLSIDDFGTGYSSMSYLKSLPVNELKIDKSFVLNLDKDYQDQKIVKAILTLAKSFNFQTVAEGVESEESLLFLKSLKCDWAQGYFISKPMPMEMVAEWIKRYNKETEQSAAD